MTTFHVAVTGSDRADGTQDAPFRTINRAARAAMPGDTVQVHEGTYREWVRPVRGGIGDDRRITFEAAPGEHVAIKGSEIVTGWVREEGTVWRADVPNTLFGDFNPFAETVVGDWLHPGPGGVLAHRGDVYLNGRSFYEVHDRADLHEPERRTRTRYSWTALDTELVDPDQTVHVWHAEVSDDVTTIRANFHDADPNAELVEINVRPAVFYPERSHLDYITVRGFELAQAATPWTPPTADQPGLVGPNWAKGWVIEDNLVRDAKCSGVSLGKNAASGDNFGYERGDKPGYQYQIEAVFTASHQGWDREHVGSHVVRRNEIRDCGQNGVVGHLGAVFSTIEDNHIHHIGTKHEFYGYEIGAIKLHAPLDVEIVHNRIHDTTLGIWLDWQVQGTRISRNVLYRNIRDLFIEVSHGPATVDHNVLASPIAIELFSQGNAFVNNLVLGAVRMQAVLDRATPYHVPHSTQVAGYAFIYAGDDRYVGNLFVGAPRGVYGPDAPIVLEEFPPESFGTHTYEGFPASWEEYQQRVGVFGGAGDHARFHLERQPAYVRSNAYADGARPVSHETDALTVAGAAVVRVVDEGDEVFLETELPGALTAPVTGVTTGADLGHVRIAGAGFESRDGSPVVADVDLVGARKELGSSYPAGPLASLDDGATRVRVW
ncbi:right-handed parallel beta-helix repeat-containing protein [Actinotalea sp. Marseille-Q4924]|uniref:right-handed parallel beta-helix repeat-containing protein n=1 Tax=Actinotalea sp. Marseille-Q4924 TaxID=2866571 RepID=UPI001CE3F30D|nr:right-handed parallel beta-helix repeat-containing protein [Actinotalea sp. Marseille-Q4924]